MAIMKYTGQILVIFCFFFPFSLQAATNEIPQEIAGIALGTSIDDYPDIIRNNFLQEVVVTDWHGFRKGIISYGTCRHIDLILKMDMKYENKSKDFFQILLKEFRQKFGEPDKWKGDSFGLIHIWKWHFVDQDQNRVSMSLQHNAKDSDETIGNVVKLSFPEKIEEERLCFINMCKDKNEMAEEKRKEELKKADWSHLIPQ